MSDLRIGPASGEGFYVMQGNGIVLHVFKPYPPETIVRAVNARDGLLSACKAALARFHESFSPEEFAPSVADEISREIEQLETAILRAEN